MEDDTIDYGKGFDYEIGLEYAAKKILVRNAFGDDGVLACASQIDHKCRLARL